MQRSSEQHSWENGRLRNSSSYRLRTMEQDQYHYEGFTNIKRKDVDYTHG
jgi:hypothetical protein